MTKQVLRVALVLFAWRGIAIACTRVPMAFPSLQFDKQDQEELR
jgi:hypothetical protein